MNEALFVSNILLWLVVVALIGVVFALTRQVGALLERVAPVGALSVAHGPAVGDAAPEMVVRGLAGESITLGGADAFRRRTLLFFLSPTCPVCKTLLPTLARIVAEESPGLRLVYASDGDAAEQRAFVREQGLERAEYTLSRELGLVYEVAKLPYAVLLDANGVVRAKGLVNTREHLESLFEADRLGVGSLQEFALRESKREPFEVVSEGGAR